MRGMATLPPPKVTRRQRVDLGEVIMGVKFKFEFFKEILMLLGVKICPFPLTMSWALLPACEK